MPAILLGAGVAWSEPREADEPWYGARESVRSRPLAVIDGEKSAEIDSWPMFEPELSIEESDHQVTTTWRDPWAPGSAQVETWMEPLAAVPPSERSREWTWQCLPDGLMYRAYLAGVKESRFSTAYLYSSKRGWIWDSTLGGQVGVVRFGTPDAVRPEGFQLDLEGAVFARLDVESKDDLESADFRVGFPLTWSQDEWSFKFGYYHFSSHLGDEFLLRHPSVRRINYVRDGLLLGASLQVTDDWRAYSEAGWAFKADGGAKPWEFQFGTEFTPPPPRPGRAAPYTAVHANLRQEVRFGGNINVVAGWQWRGETSDRLWRIGLQYFNGKSSQYAFFRRSEQLTGLGLWFDY